MEKKKERKKKRKFDNELTSNVSAKESLVPACATLDKVNTRFSGSSNSAAFNRASTLTVT